MLKSVLAEEVEEIEVLSESEEIGTEPETLIGEEEPPQIIEELEGQQELLSKPLENLLDEDVDTMELAELDSPRTNSRQVLAPPWKSFQIRKPPYPISPNRR